MRLTRGDIRARILRSRSWASNGATFNAEINTIINEALQELAEDLPDVILPAVTTVTALPDITSGSLSSTLYAQWDTTDPRLLYFTLGTSTSITSVWVPDTSRLWDGRYWIQMTHRVTGVQLRRRCTHFVIAANVYYAAVDDGLPDEYAYDTDGDNQWTFRLYQPEIYLPGDTLHVYSEAKVRSLTRYQPVALVNAYEAWRDADYFHFHEVTGPPQHQYRGAYHQLPSPRRAPVVTVDPALAPTAWAGPSYSGSFKFRYTYVLGSEDPLVSVSKSGLRDPLWESAPSEATAAITVTTNSILITANNIDAQWGFDEPGATIADHSGMRIRFYVARTAISGAAGDAGHAYVESAEEDYVLLAEVDPTVVVSNRYASYLWTGTTPDASRPLRHSPGYYAYHLYPRPDQKYHIDFNIVRRPTPLLHDSDAPPLQPGMAEVLVEKALYHTCLRDGVDVASADYHLKRYMDLRERARTRLGDTAAPINPSPLTTIGNRVRFGTYSERE